MDSDMTQRNNESPHLAQATTVPARAQAEGEVAAIPAVPAIPPIPAIPVPIPRGGGRWIIEKDGNRTTITSTALPPQFIRVAERAQETAFGLIGILAAIVFLGPFARMWARRLEKRSELDVAGVNAQLLQKQLVELQQSMDAMSVEVERISESQRFQSKLLYEKAERATSQR